MVTNPSNYSIADIPGSFTLNLDSAGAGIDSDFRNGLAPSATKTGGDADNPISGILQTLTGLGATKLEQPNSGIGLLGQVDLVVLKQLLQVQLKDNSQQSILLRLQ